MNQELELELTYLAKELPAEIGSAEPIRIVDIYVPETAQRAQLRLRQKGDKYEITKKTLLSQKDASRQIEQTIPLSKDEFLALSKASSRRVAKNRYAVNIAGYDAEVDVFVGELEGLVLIDFEFATETEKNSFAIPEVALADVTQESFIAGGSLAGKSYADIEPELARFGYEKI